MSTSLEIENPEHPKVYLKHERIDLKSLAKPYGQEYMFWSRDGGIKNCVKLLNNLNEVVARCFHKTNRISNYFGIGKEPDPESLFHDYMKNLKIENEVSTKDIRKVIDNVEFLDAELVTNNKEIKESLSEILVLLNNINDKT